MIPTRKKAPKPLAFLATFARPAVPGLPKYAQLREVMVAAIHAGYWKPGQKLPTELDLADGTPFSLGTVQRALRALVEEGLVTRSQGSGTFVTEHRKPLDAPIHLQFLRDGASGDYLPIYPHVIGRERVREPGPWREFLGAGADIMRIDRRFSIGDEFSVYSRLFFDAHALHTVATRPLASLDKVHIKRLLASELNAPVTQVEQRIRMARFAPAICKAIGVKAGTHGMVLESCASGARGRRLYYLESYIPPNDRRLDVTELRQRAARPPA